MFAKKISCGFPILAILLAAKLIASNKLEHDPDTSACLDKINNYLSTFGMDSDRFEGSQRKKIELGELLTNQMIMALDQAKDHLEQPLERGESVGSIFMPLSPSNRCSRRKLLATVGYIRQALDNCDQVSLDYLMIVANYMLTASDKVLINRLARNRLELCWQRFISGVSHQLDRVMGKMTKPVFRNLEQIAEMMIETRKGLANSQSDHAMDNIHIDEQKARDRALAEAELKFMGKDQTSLDLMRKRPETFLAILETIKGVDFERNERIREFSLAIHKLFKKQQKGATKDRRELRRLLREFLSGFLGEPCRELVDRVRSVVALGEIYRRHIEQTLGQALAEEKQLNPRLNYELEIYRVCKFELAKEDTILEFMEKAS